MLFSFFLSSFSSSLFVLFVCCLVFWGFFFCSLLLLFCFGRDDNISKFLNYQSTFVCLLSFFFFCFFSLGVGCFVLICLFLFVLFYYVLFSCVLLLVKAKMLVEDL